MTAFCRKLSKIENLVKHQCSSVLSPVVFQDLNRVCPPPTTMTTGFKWTLIRFVVVFAVKLRESTLQYRYILLHGQQRRS